MKHTMQRMRAAALAGLLAFGMASHTLASAANTPKEEVVYANLNENGSVSDVYIVNIFDVAGNEMIIDYGQYADVKNLSTNASIICEGDSHFLQAEKGRLYYQGTLNRTEMPWLIQVTYYIDGMEIPAERLGGCSGAIEIHIDISKNPTANPIFYQTYALQISLALDAARCTNIVARDATMANVGSKKQLMFTILPDKGANLIVKADASDFEMDQGISISAVRLSLSVDVDDTEIMDKITDLQDAIQELKNGAGKLADGSRDLADGAFTLSDGAEQLSGGAQELADAVLSLNDGVFELKSGIKKLDGGILQLEEGAGTLQAGMNTLEEQSGTLTDGSSQLLAAVERIKSAIDGFSSARSEFDELTNGSTAVEEGLSTLVNSIAQLQASFDTFDDNLSATGLNPSSLSSQNVAAIQQIQETILPSLANQREQMINDGGDTSDIDAQISALSDIAELLGANDSLISADAQFFGKVQSGVDALYGTESNPGASYLLTRYQEMDVAIQTLSDTLSDMSSGMAQIQAGMATLETQFVQFDAGITSYTNGYQQILSGYNTLYDSISTLLNGSSRLLDGMAELRNGSLDLLDGARTLAGKTDDLSNGAIDVSKGAQELNDGTTDLYDGTEELNDRTEDMDDEVKDQIDEITNKITGNNENAVSFASPENTNIKAVQFVMKTKAIEKPATEQPAQEQEQTMTFWQKMAKLFGLD